MPSSTLSFELLATNLSAKDLVNEPRITRPSPSSGHVPPDTVMLHLKSPVLSILWRN